MAYTLKQDGTGSYVLDTQDQVKPVTPKVTPTPGEFEAYEGTQDRTELLGGTTLGEQTQKVLREAPGEYQLEFDPETGEVLYHVELATVTLHFFEDEWDEFSNLILQAIR